MIKKIKVINAHYVAEADSILIVGETEEGTFSNQIHSNCFAFGDKNKTQEMEKTASLLIGKTINMEFDESVDQREI